MQTKNEIAVFAGGCFWCTEAMFNRLKGANKVTSGYAGGTKENPTYEEVSQGNTGHAEAVKVEFNPEEISYNTLLNVFWSVHNPTNLNRQGADIGTQYRSLILYTSQKQKESAEKSLEKMQKSGIFDKPIVTQIKSLKNFYQAENYHQDYYTKNYGQPYCELVISPKIMHLREKFAHLIKK